MIPASKLCGITSGHSLRCDAATAYLQLASAYQKRFGKTLCITDSYRSYSSQVDLYGRKPSLAALPGTSNHGWGLAVDLCGGIDRFGTTQHQWMVQNAPNFGWVHPNWARQGGNREEPWHWEYERPASA
jgi:LAS superfamily LD-carboxypeptidase LdcB